MESALIIGGAGFVGKYLIDHIRKHCMWSLSVTKIPEETIDRENIAIYDLDILDKRAVAALLEETGPDYIFHLAAQSSVALSWKNPQLTVDVNVKGTINLLEAIRNLDYIPRILLIGSGEEYGHTKPEEIPITEENLTRPGNIYAVTKICQNMIGKIYTDAYDMHIISVRAFNHIGPTQSPQFVVADFCKQVAEIERGEREAVIKVGNLSAKRDFTDVQDVVRAYTMLMTHGKKGETYNVGSGKAVAIKEILDQILKLAKVPIKIEVDPSKIRPVDVPIIEADIRKIMEATFWAPKIPLEQSLRETLEYWRGRGKGASLE
jgi:GDP-4-dehydro-6-deoxy-D-mannose reductase